MSPARVTYPIVMHNKNMTTLFRALIVASLLSYAIVVCIGHFDAPYLSEKELDLLSWYGHGAVIELSPFMNWVLILVWLPAAIGMYLFNSIARFVYLFLAILIIITTPLFGAYIALGYEFMFLQITTFLDGAILVMAYFTSVSDKFKNA